MTIQPTMNAPSHDIQLRGLSDNSVAVDDSKASGMEGGEGNDTSLHEENPTDSEITKEYPTGLKFWLIILTMAALIILGGLDTNIVATAVPSITDEFHTMADVGWYSSGFRLLQV